MTTLYRPVLIESAEQAEALPDGTVASRDYYDEGYGYHHYDCARKVEGGSWIQIGILDDYESALVLGWTALVPIEAAEETRPDTSAIRPWGETTPDPLPKQTRYVTPWEAS